MTADNASDPSNARIAPEEAHFGANDIGWQALGPALACSLLATASVAARWYSRSRLARCRGVDDYVILLSLLLSWAMTAIIGVAFHAANPHPPAPRASRIARLLIAANILWILAVNITKASLLTQYLRLFHSPRPRALCYTLLFALLPAAAYAIFAGLFLCNPTPKLWRPDLPGSCRGAQTYWLSVAGLDIALDVAVLVLPLPLILRLRLPSSRHKAALVAAFALGFAVCLVAVARLVSVHVAAQRGRYVESGVWAVVWSAVEANVGILCACLLALKPLAAKLWPRWFTEGEGGTLPRHAMRLRHVDTLPGSGSGGDYGMSVPPATPSSGVSKEGSAITWPKACVLPRGSSPPGRSEVERVGVVEEEERGEKGEEDAMAEEEGMSIWDVLQQPEEAVSRR